MSRYKGIENTLRAGVGLSALLLTLVAAGCAEQPTMILIRGAALSDSSCVLSTDPAAFLTEGVLDVSIASGYVLAPNLQNVAPSSSTVGAQGKTTGGSGAVFNNLAVEGNNVIITEAQVDFELITAAAIPAEVASIFRGYDLPIGGAVIEPNGGKATFGMSVLNSTHVTALQQVVSPGSTLTVMVKLKLFGVTTSDTEVESNTFNFPILVCNGCLTPADCSVAPADTSHCIMPGQDFSYCPPAVDPVVP
ncbi:MAG: hypothetical protein CO108_22650 [Deltaproteobacteria bacterium CG_4_9_14_3_um_filter_63_12]|nr:MAG: hypothetical protein CO108_22650 [Deltaproteobacteria bacterium CG_4_9_14_3_um_filter_63_12]